MKIENERISKCRMVAICIVLITRPIMYITCRTSSLYYKTLNRLMYCECVGRKHAFTPLFFLLFSSPPSAFFSPSLFCFFLSVCMSLKKKSHELNRKVLLKTSHPKTKDLVKM